jgi:multicomponent K+:H+ antiporter subunit A
MPQHIFLIVLIVLPFAGSIVVALLPDSARNAAAWLAGGIAITGLIIVSAFYPAVLGGASIRHDIAWLPQFGLTFSLRLDGFAWAFAILITGIGALVMLYARYYISPSDPVARFFSLLLAFMGAMLGIALSGNLIQLVFFWELTSILSFLLIGYWHHNASARAGARMALTVTATGGLCLFAGVIVLGHIVGSYDLDVVLSSGNQIRAHPLYLTALVLVLLGALTKSAQFPFHFWLPQAMNAPTPVSAYLHSAAMVKAGVFLLVRLWPAMGGTDYWLWLVGTAGLTTFVLGAFLAVFQQDLKGLLAYSTISHLGLITLLIGLDRPLALVAAIFHMLNHATFKASLFMAAGIIDHETGTRDIRRLSGLWRFMPITAVLAMVAAAAMAGVPLLNGFLSKEMFFAETIETHDGSMLDDALPYIVTLASMFSVAYSLRFIRDVFFGPPPTDLPRTPHEPPRWMRFPVEVLVVSCLVVGIVPALTIGPILDTAVHAVLGPAVPAYSLAVWHGFTFPLLMSGVALAGGVATYLVLRKDLRTAVDGPRLLRGLDAAHIFERVLVMVSWRWARFLEGFLGTQRLQPQLLLLVCAALVAALWPVYQHGLGAARITSTDIDPAFAAVWVVGIACALGSAYLAKYHRLAAVILGGGAGLATCITFVWLSAVDLALTQLVVEIVTTVLLLLGLRWLPKRLEVIDLVARAKTAGSTRRRRLRDLTVAVMSGSGLSILAYSIMTSPAPNSISKFFLERAYTDGGGTNVVNVILVDFRGFDTLGEITVLGVVALTVFALLRRFRPAADSVGIPEQQNPRNALHDDHFQHDADGGFLPIPAVIVQLLFPFMLTLAMFLFLRGHDLPGGGFIAGITMAIALIVQYMAGGIRLVETRLRISPLRWISFGLLTAACAGAAPWLFSRPFLTSYANYAELPLIGAVPTASAIIFDLGVFLLVVGATALMLVALAHQSIRSHRAARSSATAAPAEDT